MHFRPFPVFCAYVFLIGKLADPNPPSLLVENSPNFFFETFPKRENFRILNQYPRGSETLGNNHERTFIRQILVLTENVVVLGGRPLRACLNLPTAPMDIYAFH